MHRASVTGCAPGSGAMHRASHALARRLVDMMHRASPAMTSASVQVGGISRAIPVAISSGRGLLEALLLPRAGGVVHAVL